MIFLYDVADANDATALKKALQAFKAEQEKPTLIVVKSVIGYGAPKKDQKKKKKKDGGAEDEADSQDIFAMLQKLAASQGGPGGTGSGSGVGGAPLIQGTELLASLTQLQQAQERWRGNRAAYASNDKLALASPDGLGVSATTPSGGCSSSTPRAATARRSASSTTRRSCPAR